MEGRIYKFFAQTTTPFHTTAHQYATMVKCAPNILGSTIRGTLLKTMIENYNCPHISQLEKAKQPLLIRNIHLNCTQDCLVKPFFSPNTQAFFSFGEFTMDIPMFFSSSIRIGINRKYNSVCEGAIENIEAVLPQIPFEFTITLFNESLRIGEEVKKIIKLMANGLHTGLGRFRSIGYGQFKIFRIEEKDFIEEMNEEIENLYQMEIDKKIRLIFETPLVLGDGKDVFYHINENKTLSKEIAVSIKNTAREIIDEEQLLPINQVGAQIRPDFISRFSFEQGDRENRLVAAKDSCFILHLSDFKENYLKQLAIASLLGIGNWNEYGFGRFEIKGEAEEVGVVPKDEDVIVV